MGGFEKAHAVIPKYKGGELTEENTALLPRPLHALHHYLVGDSAPDEKTKRINFWAVNAIISRETPEEEAETHRLISLHNRKK